MVEDLVRWLNTQLDEDQRIAREAAMAIGRTGYENGVLVDPPARFGDDLVVDGAQWAPSYHQVMRKRLRPDETRRTVAECGGFGARPVADHIAEWDPARVLREIDAKRKLLAEWKLADAEGKYPDFMGGYSSGLDYAVQLAAVAYADRPGYDPEWAPRSQWGLPEQP